MQTFLPLPSIEKSVKCLDWKRLGCQRKEAKQILDCLMGVGSRSWVSHPCVKMWKNHEEFLAWYMNSCIEEWIRRGYKNTMRLFLISLHPTPPLWWGGPIHSSHRAALLYKNPEWYSQFNWNEEPRIEYYWPTKQ